MKANGIFAAHNLVEVKTDKGWVVLDPSYDIYFIRPDNKMASFADIRNNCNRDGEGQYYFPAHLFFKGIQDLVLSGHAAVYSYNHPDIQEICKHKALPVA
jgi:hypothetical protein